MFVSALNIVFQLDFFIFQAKEEHSHLKIDLKKKRLHKNTRRQRWNDARTFYCLPTTEHEYICKTYELNSFTFFYWTKLAIRQEINFNCTVELAYSDLGYSKLMVNDRLY